MASFDIDITPPKYGPGDFSKQLYDMIRGVPAAYQEGAEGAFKRGQYARTEELQKPINFIGADGKPDLAAGLQEYIKRAGGEGFEKLYPALQGQQSNEALFRILSGGQAPPASGATPGAAGEQPASGATEAKADTVRSLAIKRGIDPDTPGFADQFGAVGLDRDLPPGAVQGVVNKFDMLREAGMFGPSPSAGASGEQSSPIIPNKVQTVQATPIQREAIGAPAGGPATPVGNEAEARFYEDRGQKRIAASAIYGASPKAAEAAQKAAEQDFARAKAIREKLAEYGAPTTAQKEAPPGMSVPQAAAHKRELEDLGAAKVKNVAGYIEAIKPARQTIQVLDEMDNALTQGWNHISTGAGAKQWLEVKKAVNNMMPGTFANVAEAETVEKLNAQLAAAAAKAMTARPSQLEFKAFMANNPGLLTSREGSKVLISLMRQAKQQELELGRMAERFQPGAGQNWSDIEDRYYRTHHIISPFTNKPIDAKRAADGNWYRPDPDRPGRYLQEK
jgi:hypothetical protein